MDVDSRCAERSFDSPDANNFFFIGPGQSAVSFLDSGLARVTSD